MDLERHHTNNNNNNNNNDEEIDSNSLNELSFSNSIKYKQLNNNNSNNNNNDIFAKFTKENSELKRSKDDLNKMSFGSNNATAATAAAVAAAATAAAVESAKKKLLHEHESSHLKKLDCSIDNLNDSTSKYLNMLGEDLLMEEQDILINDTKYIYNNLNENYKNEEEEEDDSLVDDKLKVNKLKKINNNHNSHNQNNNNHNSNHHHNNQNQNNQLIDFKEIRKINSNKQRQIDLNSFNNDDSSIKSSTAEHHTNKTCSTNSEIDELNSSRLDEPNEKNKSEAIQDFYDLSKNECLKLIDQLNKEIESERIEKSKLKNKLNNCIMENRKLIAILDQYYLERDEVLKEMNNLKQTKSKESKRAKTEMEAICREYSLVMSERDSVHKEMEALQEQLSKAQDRLKKYARESVAYVGSAAATNETNSSNYGTMITTSATVTENLNESINIPAIAAATRQQKVNSVVFGYNMNGIGSMDEGLEIDSLKQQLNLVTRQRDEAIIQIRELYHQLGSISDSNDTEYIDRYLNEKTSNVKPDEENEKLKYELKELLKEIENAKKRRDIAFNERDKMLKERESIRALCDDLRHQRDKAISELAEALHESDELRKEKRMAYRQIQILEKNIAVLEEKINFLRKLNEMKDEQKEAENRHKSSQQKNSTTNNDDDDDDEESNWRTLKFDIDMNESCELGIKLVCASDVDLDSSNDETINNNNNNNNNKFEKRVGSIEKNSNCNLKKNKNENLTKNKRSADILDIDINAGCSESKTNINETNKFQIRKKESQNRIINEDKKESTKIKKKENEIEVDEENEKTIESSNLTEENESEQDDDDVEEVEDIEEDYDDDDDEDNDNDDDDDDDDGESQDENDEKNQDTADDVEDENEEIVKIENPRLLKDSNERNPIGKKTILITHIDENGLAYGKLKVFDRLLKINDLNVQNMKISVIKLIISNLRGTVSFVVLRHFPNKSVNSSDHIILPENSYNEHEENSELNDEEILSTSISLSTFETNSNKNGHPEPPNSTAIIKNSNHKIYAENFREKSIPKYLVKNEENSSMKYDDSIRRKIIDDSTRMTSHLKHNETLNIELISVHKNSLNDLLLETGVYIAAMKQSNDCHLINETKSTKYLNEKSLLAVGDRILSINGLSLTNKTLFEIMEIVHQFRAYNLVIQKVLTTNKSFIYDRNSTHNSSSSYSINRNNIKNMSNNNNNNKEYFVVSQTLSNDSSILITKKNNQIKLKSPNEKKAKITNNNLNDSSSNHSFYNNQKSKATGSNSDSYHHNKYNNNNNNNHSKPRYEVSDMHPHYNRNQYEIYHHYPHQQQEIHQNENHNRRTMINYNRKQEEKDDYEIRVGNQNREICKKIDNQNDVDERNRKYQDLIRNFHSQCRKENQITMIGKERDSELSIADSKESNNDAESKLAYDHEEATEDENLKDHKRIRKANLTEMMPFSYKRNIKNEPTTNKVEHVKEDEDQDDVIVSTTNAKKQHESLTQLEIKKNLTL